MKTVIILGETGSELLTDALNQRIVKELVFNEFSVTELARKLNSPPLKIWRRIQKLAKAALIELVRVDRVGNIEKKLYRATATNFVSRQFLDLVPKNEKLREAFRTYLELQRKVMSNMSSLSEIPKEADPVDYAIYFSVKSFCEAFLNPELKPKLLQLEREISRVELDQQFVVEQAK